MGLRKKAQKRHALNVFDVDEGHKQKDAPLSLQLLYHSMNTGQASDAAQREKTKSEGPVISARWYYFSPRCVTMMSTVGLDSPLTLTLIALVRTPCRRPGVKTPVMRPFSPGA